MWYKVPCLLACGHCTFSFVDIARGNDLLKIQYLGNNLIETCWKCYMSYVVIKIFWKDCKIHDPHGLSQQKTLLKCNSEKRKHGT